MGIQNAYKRTCPGYGKQFETSHRNRRYCDKQCQIRSNDLRTTEKREIQDAIANRHTDTHWKNREILRRFVDEDVPHSTLKAKGFNYEFVTEWQIAQDETCKVHYVYYVCDYYYILFKEKGAETILLDIPPNGMAGSVFRRFNQQPIEVPFEIAFKGG